MRYDEKTSREVLDNCAMLLKTYDGSLNRLHEQAVGGRDLEKRLLAFYGVGPATVNIFLRELRPFWKKDNVKPAWFVGELAGKYGIDLNSFSPKTITFVRIEAGLVRLRKELSRTLTNGTSRPSSACGDGRSPGPRPSRH